MRLRILYIHHCPVFGGSSKSLFEAISHLPASSTSPVIICPEGTSKAAFTKIGCPIISTIGISQFDHTVAGHYKKFRWLILLREFFFLPFNSLALIKAKIKYRQFDIIHINDITLLPSIFLASLLFPKTPIIMHARALVEQKRKIRYFLLTSFINKFVARAIAIDESVARTLTSLKRLKIIHNGFSLDSKLKTDSALKWKKKYQTAVIFIGNILENKGILEFVEAANLCIKKGASIEFIVLGDKTPRLASRILAEKIEKYVAEENITDQFKIIGHTQDINPYLEQSDILCFPSHLNAVGRPVFEAAFFKVPSIVASRSPLPRDVIVHNETGIVVPEKNKSKLATAILDLHDAPEKRKKLGENAYKLAMENFDISKNAEDLFQTYLDLIKNH